MELVVRGSEYQDFLTCRKKWYYSWIKRIKPKRPDNKLFFGEAFHKWLEFYYQNGCDDNAALQKLTEWIQQQDTSGMDDVEINEMIDLLHGTTQHYHRTYGENDKKWKVLGTEVEFIVKLDEGLFYTGTIDLVIEEDGKIKFFDHKTVSSIQMYVEKSVMDRQLSRYWWALKMIAAGIGRVKNEEGLWVRWQEIEGREIEGCVYNLIAKDYPREPKILKSGKISTDKSQKTTYDLYLQTIHALGQNPDDYKEMLDYLKEKPDPFLRRVNVLRTEQELEAAMWEFAYTSADMHDVLVAMSRHPETIETLTYRNIGHHCMNMCEYRPLCQTVIEGGNVSLVENLAYTSKEDDK
jgi:hypothetical protein